MKARNQWVLVGMLAISVTACVDAGQTNLKTGTPADPVIGLLNKGIQQLDGNIKALSKRMSDVQQASVGTDPVLQELQALDLSGWQLHRQQWVLQRDHLTLARDSLQQATGQPEQKKQLVDQWRVHQQQYLRAIEELRQQRRDLEDKHVEVEARLVERQLQ
jgi:chromosome segregation ATPase